MHTTANTNKNFWEKIACVYSAFMKKNEKTYLLICQVLEKYISSMCDVLELACRSGQLTFHLCDKAAKWIATDYSEKMVSECKKHQGNHKVLIEVADATNLNYEKDSFDIVVIANALHIMPDPDAAMKEIKRVLKPDGILCAPTFVYDDVRRKFLLRMMEKAGFITYHKWKLEEFKTYISAKGLEIISCELVESYPLKECILIAKKSRYRDS